MLFLNFFCAFFTFLAIYSKDFYKDSPSFGAFFCAAFRRLRQMKPPRPQAARTGGLCLCRRLFHSVENVQKFADAIEIVPRVIVDIDPALLIRTDQGDLRFKRAAQALYQIFQLRARQSVLLLLFARKHFFTHSRASSACDSEGTVTSVRA